MTDMPPTAEDFATARFATRPDGRFAARIAAGTHPGLYPWRCSDIPGRSDRAMAEDGFILVRECPDPEQHGPIDYKVLLEQAERERDEALVGVRVLARETIECHERAAADCGHPNHGNQDHGCAAFLPAAESRPLTAREHLEAAMKGGLTREDIPNDMCDRLVASRADTVRRPTAPGDEYPRGGVRDDLLAALTEPPARPEGAEEWEDWLIHNLDHEALTDQQIEDLANRVAQRVVEERS